MSDANLHELMLLYLADALTDEEHAVVKARLSEGDPEAIDALREARELYAALPLSLDPVELGAGSADDLMRQVEADALRGETPKPKRKPQSPRRDVAPRERSVMDTPAAMAPPQPMPIDRRPGWVVPAALAAGFAIAASAAVFFLARWDAQQQLTLLRNEATALQQQLDAQQQRLAEQDDRLAEQRERIEQHGGTLQAQRELIDAQREQLAAQAGRIDRVAFSVQAQEAVTDELRALFASQRNDLLVLMNREEEVSRVLSLLSAPRLEAYVLAETGEVPGAAGRMFYDPATGRLRLTVAGLGPAAAGRTYQAWFVLEDGAGAPVSLGTFDTNAAGDAVFEATLDQMPEQIALAAVSVEPEGGVSAPTGAIVIAGAAQ